MATVAIWDAVATAAGAAVSSSCNRDCRTVTVAVEAAAMATVAVWAAVATAAGAAVVVVGTVAAAAKARVAV